MAARGHARGTLANVTEDAGGLLRIAATHNRLDIVKLLLVFGFDPDERTRLGDGDDAPMSWGMALQHCASNGKYDIAEMLLRHGADPNARIYASGDPVFSAYSARDWKMLALLERHGGTPNATSAGLFRQTDLARRMLAGQSPYRLDGVGGDDVAEQLLWGAACGGDPEIVRLALERVTWPRDDPRWFDSSNSHCVPGRTAHRATTLPRDAYLRCFAILLDRCDPNVRGRPTDEQQFGLTTLHNIVARGDMTPDERVAFATAILDRGARLDVRDNLLKSTPLGWACRWGQVTLVALFLARGADPIELESEPWAQPMSLATSRGHQDIADLLRSNSANQER